MNFELLKSTIGIRNGSLTKSTVSLSAAKLTDNLADVFTHCYFDQTLVIDSPVLVDNDDETQTVVISGMSNYLNAPDLPVVLTCSLDSDGNVQLLARYEVLGANPGPNDWKFSKSFPDLPRVPDDREPLCFNRETGETCQPEVAPLDEYNFFNCSFVVSSRAMTDPESGAKLRWGINFIGSVRPEGVLAMTANVFKVTNDLPVSGTIRPPVRNETPAMLRTRFAGAGNADQYPWTVADEFDKGVPGVLLGVDIGFDYSMANDNILFSCNKIYIYSPPNRDWARMDVNPHFFPIQAFTGSIELPNADITAEMLIPFEFGIDQLLFISRFEAVSLENLDKLTGLAGSDEGRLSHMPKQIADMGDALGNLELTAMSFAIDYRKPADIDLTRISFTIGMQELNWDVWKGHTDVDNIYSIFEIDYPFKSAKAVGDPDFARQINVMVYGEMEIEGTPYSVYAESNDGFSVYAETDSGHVIPLGRLLNRCAPANPAPATLDVDLLRLSMAPGNPYNLAMAAAGSSYPAVVGDKEREQEPEPWKIPVGFMPLEVYDVLMFV